MSEYWPSGQKDPWEMRASDEERDKVISALNEHYAQGRLDYDELNVRLDQVSSSQTRGELERVVQDLPVPAGFLGDPGPAQPVPTPPKRSFRERTGLSNGQLVLLVIAAMILLPILGRILQGFMPILVIGLVIWLVQRNRMRKF